MIDRDRLHLPYFVYGTLRPAFGNSRIWRSLGARCEHDGDAYVLGFDMFGGSIPFAIRSDDPTSRIVGAVIRPPAGMDAVFLRAQLDSLEGHPTGYQRITTTAHTPDGEIDCWIYSPTSWHPGGEPEPTGDFIQLTERRRKEREAWLASSTPQL